MWTVHSWGNLIKNRISHLIRRPWLAAVPSVIMCVCCAAFASMWLTFAPSSPSLSSPESPRMQTKWTVNGSHVSETSDPSQGLWKQQRTGFDGSTGEIEGLGKKKGADICEIWGGVSGAELETWGPLPLGAKNKRDVLITSSIFLQPEVITLLNEHTHTPMDCIHTLWHLNECAHVQQKHMSFVSCQRVECLMSNINYSDGSTHAALRGVENTHDHTYCMCSARHECDMICLLKKNLHSVQHGWTCMALHSSKDFHSFECFEILIVLPLALV